MRAAGQQVVILPVKTKCLFFTERIDFQRHGCFNTKVLKYRMDILAKSKFNLDLGDSESNTQTACWLVVDGRSERVLS